MHTHTAPGNHAQAAAWNGPEGASWARRSVPPPADGDLTHLILEAADPAPSDRSLDVGCGIGELTRRLAQWTPSGTATGLDLSELMIRQARDEAARVGVTNVAFEVGDAQVHPLPPSGFDLVVSHFGVMFFDEPVAAFTNLTGALRPGGRLVVVVPRAMATCDWYGVPLGALLGRGDRRRRPTEDDAPSAMFSLAEPARLDATLAAAGLADISRTQIDHALWFGADVDAAVDGYLGSGPVRGILERSADLTPERARELLCDALAPHVGPDGVRLPGSHWLVEAARVA